MDYRTALESVVTRITDLTPSRDPGTRYRHDVDGRLDDLPDDRMFIVEPLTLDWLATPAAGQPVLATVNVSVRYAKSQSDWVSKRSAAEDLEQLFAWLSYLPGQEWKAGLTVEVESASIQESDGIRMVVTLRLVWTSV